MTSVLSPYITVSELDYLRLTRLMSQLSREFMAMPACAQLAETLEQADQLAPAEMPRDLVTMHSRLAVQDESGVRQELTLCYPDEADAATGYVSVLSPMGARLLGATVPGVIDWTPPEGAPRQLQALELLYQPEASGDFAK